MKNLLSLFFLTLNLNVFSQVYNFDFETEPSDIIIYRDTISNPNCIWQIGQPNKATFTSAYSGNNVIVTDTINPYPIDDTSSFIIKHRVRDGFLINGGTVSIQGHYYCESDTLNDYGKIEFSPNNGLDWILISKDTALGVDNNSWPIINELRLTGRSFEWKYFEIDLNKVNELYTFQDNDSVQFKFTFYSDPNNESRDGLMFDDISILDVFGGGLNYIKSDKIKTYPNPFSNALTILPVVETSDILLYNLEGRLIYSQKLQSEKLLEINTSEFVPGIYLVVQKDKNGVIINSEKLVK